MKVICYILSFLLISFAFIYPQWQWQNPLPQGNTLFSIMHVNENTIWASASGASLIKSNDGGVTWEVIVLPERIFAEDVFFINEQTGWTCGQTYGDTDYLLLGTTDCGETWSIQLFDSFGSFESIEFANEEDGWLANGNSIYNTTDGGENWQSQDFFSYNIYSINVLDSLHVYAAGTDADGGGILSTSNGGIVWNEDPTIEWAYDVYFLDTLTGWTSGRSYIAKTTDGGGNWEVQLDMFRKNWIDIFMKDENYGWAVSSDGLIVGTADGGDNWLLQNNPTGKGLNGVSFKDSVNGIIVGSLATFLKTGDGGSNWQSVTQSVTEETLFGLNFINENKGWIVGGNGTILKTTNGGQNWVTNNSGVTERLRDIFFIDESKGWAVGANGKMVWTTDGGELWNNRTLQTDLTLWTIDFNYYPTGWTAAGGSLVPGVLFKTINGGSSWNIVSTISLSAGYYEIQFTSNEVGWIMASNGTIGGEQHLYRTTNGGDGWEVILSNYTDTTYMSMYFLNDSIGWISTFPSYTLFKTTDGGNSWIREETPQFFNSLYFHDTLIGWAGASSGEIYYTSDGGNTWTGQNCPVGLFVGDLQFVGENNGWAIGGVGNIVHTTNGGTSFVNLDPVNTFPDNFTLYQNYPNPFNSMTRIKFSLAQIEVVSLKIYDVLGREVETLINEDRPAVGHYEIMFDASTYGLSSGIYFYQLITESLSVTKKMVYLK